MAAETAYNDNAAVNHCRCVKISWRENVSGIAVNRELIWWLLHNHIVINAKIRVVIILVLAAY